MRRILYILLIACFCTEGFSQVYNSLRIKIITSDSIKAISDTLSIAPGSVIIRDIYGKAINPDNYSVDPINSRIDFSSCFVRPLAITYKVYPYSFSDPVLHKDYQLIGKAPDSSQNMFSIKEDGQKNEVLTSKDDLVRRGSISRSLTIGNNQNAVMNSTLNLQLSGKLTNDLKISAAVTDNNIPLQPDGTTTQIQEFDKVSFKVFNEKFSVLAGDFELNRNSGTFLRMNRKVRGGLFTASLPVNNDKGTVFSSQVAGAVSKGKYNRMAISAVEGNQGPYRLRGTNNETFVIIIAGSERVWVDGKLMERGLDKDYIIDYNMAEISFTPRMPITKDKRIIAEFEYTEQSYARFALFNANDWKSETYSAWLNVFHEQDSKNQPVQQDLTNEEKKLLSLSGDNQFLATVPGYYEDTLFRNDAVFYRMTDTLVSGMIYDSILVYSNNEDSGRFRATFVMTGEGNGNYIQIQSSANGKVYKWVAPENGIMQGNYEPVRILVMPKSKTVITSGGSVKISKNSEIEVEGGLSFNDKNKFSKIDDGDNAGMTFQASYRKKLDNSNARRFGTGINAYTRFTQARFDAVDRFRSAEYERDWNLPLTGNEDELLGGVGLVIASKNISISFGADGLRSGSEYTGIKENAGGSFTFKGFKWTFSGSNLNSEERTKNTSFLRGTSTVAQKAGPFLFGIDAMGEDNKWKPSESDSLISGTKRFYQFAPFISLCDTEKYPLKAGVLFRDDFIPDNGKLKYESRSRDWFLNGGIKKNQNNTINLWMTYREVTQFDSLPLQTYITGRAEQIFRTKKQFITVQTYYETGSGMELKQEYAYVEVSPGQGVFQWTDYNQNGIKELDEFEVATFSDQAVYIRVYTPGTDYVKVFNNKLSQNIGIFPDRLWSGRKGMLKFISRFSNTLSYSFDNKTSSLQWNEKINPFGSGGSDSMIVSFNRNVRNIISFNRTNQHFGVDYHLQSLDSRQLLMNGFDSRTVLSHSIKTRVNFSSNFSLLTDISSGKKGYSSEFFSSKNYSISFGSVSSTFSYQPGSTYRLSFIPRYSLKENKGGPEKAEIKEISVEFQRSVAEGSTVLLKFTGNEITYNGTSISPVSFEMLEGLTAGANYLWTVQLVKSLNKSLQMSLNYSGRKAGDSKIVNTGTVEFRAFF